MISIKSMLSLALLSGFLMWVKCTTNVAGGIGHEGEAKIYGRVVYADSDSAPAGASVFINAEDYIHSSDKSRDNRTPDATVNDSGYFFIDYYPEGKYTIEVNDGNKNAVSIHCEIKSGDTAVILTEDTLRSTSIIRGKIIDSSNTLSQMHMHLTGLERITSIDPETDSFAFDDVPSGSYSIVASLDTGNTAYVQFGTVEIKPADTLFVNYKYLPDTTAKTVSLTISLNTSSSGADVKNNIYHFPILIRLNQNNFNFTNTGNSGNDIYFTKTNGEQLPFEIEYWNSTEMNATVWVLMDTIYGNSTSQSILMHWGEHVSISKESSHDVFDTSMGFQGVWHFSELNEDTITDATANNFYGIPNGVLTDVPGQIGNAKSFNGNSDFITMPSTDSSVLNFPENGIYSLSAWIFIKSSDTIYHSIVTKGNRMFGLQVNDSADLEFYEYSEETSWNITNADINPGIWRYCTGVRDGEKQYLYIDGVCVDSTIFTHGNLRNRVTTESLCIGNRVTSSEEGFFNGYIDEVRIHNRALHPDWIKLSYVNQGNTNVFINLR